MPTGFIGWYGQLSIKIKSINKLDKEFLAILIGIVLAVIVMLFFCTKAVMGIERRDWGRTPMEFQPPNLVEVEQVEWITMEEFIERGSKSDEEIEDLVRKQNQCLVKYKTLNCKGGEL